MPHSVVADMKCSNFRYFIKIDALSGYWQCLLNKDSQLPTTFIAPKGHYKCTPFGICSISEHYNRLLDEALVGIPCVRRIVDDVVAYDATFNEHVTHVCQILEHCHRQWISWKREKFQFGCSETKFCGYILSPDGYVLIKAIQEFPCPTNITDLPSFLGLTKQLTDFRKYITKTTDPLIPLLKPSNAFLWEDCHETAFRSIKEVLSSTPILVYYDPKRMTSLHVDASWLHGLGFVLKQQQFVVHGSCRISFSDRK